MKTSLWIAGSQRFYRWLLRLYPQAHREVYEAEMFRMFTSQCQDAYKQRGRAGMVDSQSVERHSPVRREIR